MPILPDNSVEYTEEAEAITSENMTDGSSVTENNATYNDPFDYNGPADIGVPDPLPVVPVVPEEEEEYYYVTYYNRGDLTEYEPAYLQELAEAGCKFYAIYDDETEVEIQWTEIEDLDPLETEIDISASISAATNQHFWDDTNGVHVAEVAKEDWQTALEAEFSDLSSSKNYYNILMNSLGLLLRRANFILTSINRASISFYDGLGNETTNIMASFGRNSAQIGRSNDKHVVIDNSGLTAYNSDGTLAPLTGTFDGANINNSSITNTKIVDGTITGTKIASATIDNSNIKNGTIEGTKIASATIDNSNIKNGTITGAKIADGTIENTDIKNGTITGAKIASATIENSNIKDGTIQGSKIIGSTLTDIPYAGITDADIEVARVANAEIAKAEVNYAHITNGVIDNAKIDKADVNGLAATYATITNLNAATARIGTIESDYLKAADMTAEQARVNNLLADKADITDLSAATARIGDLEADHVSVEDFEAEQANIDNLQAATADIATIRANSAKVQNLTAAQLEADHATVGSLSTTYATITNLNAATGRISDLESTRVRTTDLEANYITADTIEANYTKTDLSNTDVAWIQNGTIKDGAISNAMIGSLSANKLTAGTINGNTITVTNLNADNITAGTLNGQRIGEGSLSLSKLEEDVYTESEVDSIVSNLQTQIDGAIETWTGTAVPTLNNSPASGWTTNAVKDTHVGDVYFVVNSNSQQNGYNYRFTKSGSTYSWQLIKDSDVTNALQRLTTAEGKIGTIEQFDSDISSWKTDTDEELASIKSAATTLAGRVTTAEGQIATKVETSTFNTLSQTVDENSASISQLTTETTTLTSKVETQNPFIIGTQTAQTGSWTGNASTLTSLVDGQQITYWLPFAGSGNASLNLTLKDGTTTGAIPCYYGGTTRLTTHYAANNAIHLTYRTNISGIAQGWWADANYDSNSPYSKYSDTVVSGKNGLKRYTLCMRDDAGNFTSIVNQANNINASGKTCYTGGLQLGSVCYHATGGDYDAGANSGVIWESYGGVDFRYSTNGITNAAATTELQLRKPVYLVGTIGADGLFYLDTTKWWTQTSFVEDKAYVFVGTAYSSYYAIFIAVDNPTYIYEDGELVEITTLQISKTTNKINTVSDTVDEHTRKIGLLETSVESKADGSTVETMSTKLNTVSDTVYGHTQSISSITSTQTTMQGKLDKTLVETTQLWFSKANTTAPNKPTAQVTSTSTAGNAWRVVVPAYDASYPNYYYCYQWKYSDGTYGWSSVTRDIAMGESQERARTAITNAANAQNDIDNLEIGGRNLLRDSYGSNDQTGYLVYGSVPTTVALNEFSAGDTLVLQMWDVVLDANSAGIRVYWGGGSVCIIASLKPNADGYACATTTLQESWISHTHAAAKFVNIYNFNSGHSGSSLSIGKWKLERGNRATDWSPAPEDVDADISTAQTSANNAQATADTANTNASAAVSTANTASANASNALNTANTAASDASDAKTDAAAAVSTANTASSNASTALSTANTANSNASTAVSTANTAKSTADTAKATADKNIKSTTQLWYTKANETAPAKPTTKVTSTAVSGNGWRVVVPTYASDYPYYFYCYQYELADGTYTWSDVVYDRATTENQANSRSAVTGVSTLTTKTNNIQDTVDGHTQSLQSITQTQTTIQQNAVKSTVQLWFTKANTTAPNKPTAHVTTNNAATGNAWNLAVPTYNASYPNYYYCYEYQYLDGSYGWSSVTRDIATGEMQERARTAITNAAAADTKAGNAATVAANAQADIDGLEIGGRNLLPSSIFTDNGIDGSTKELGPVALGMMYRAFGLNDGYIFGTFEENTQYVFRVGAIQSTINENWVGQTGPQFIFRYTDGTQDEYGTRILFFYKNEAELVYKTLVSNPTKSVLNFYITYGSGYSTWLFYDMKLEKGNRATDWTPAPEDVDADISTAQTSADNAQATADKNVKESVQLWFTKANGSAPNKPTSAVTSTSTSGNAWTTKVPTYSASYPHYFYCMQYKLADDTYTWSDVVYDQATTEAQSVARTTSTNLSTLQQDYATFKQTTQNFESTIGTTYATKTEVSAVDDKIDNLEIGGRNLLANTRNEAITYAGGGGYFDLSLTDWAKSNIKANDILTLSFDAYSSNSHWIDFYWRSASTSYNSDAYFFPAFQIDSSTLHYTISSDSGVDINNSEILYLRLRNNSSSHGGATPNLDVTISNLKLEKGNKATDWTPAPEDVDTAIDKVNSKTSVRLYLRRDNWNDTQWGTYSSIGRTSTFDNLHYASGGATSATNFDARTLTVGDLIIVEGVSTNTSVPYSITLKVTSVPTLAAGTISAIVISANNAKAIESRVSNAETSITQNNQQIALKANASDVYTKTQVDGKITQEVSDRNSAIEQSASAINLSVSQNYTTKTEFNALEIGGRNLTRGTSFTSDKDLSYWFKNQNAILSVESGSIKIVQNQTSSTPGAYTDISVDGGKYMVSCWYKAITDDGCRLTAFSFNSGTTRIAGHDCSITADNTDWCYYEHLFELTSDQASRVDRFYIFLNAGYGSATGGIYIKKLKIEKGNRATDWTPAPEDMVSQTEFESAKSEIKATTDGITSTVSKISSAKYLTSSVSAGASLSSIRGFASTTTMFNVTDTKDSRVGDTIYLKYKDSTRNCYVYIKGVVTAVNSSTSITLDTQGYEDVLPVDTIKSTINQSSDSVKIQARHVEIDGAAIFSNSAFKTAADAAYDAKGSASAVQTNLDNLEIGGRNLLLWTTNLPKGSDTSEQGKDGIAAWGNANSLLSETADGIKLTAASNSQECIGIPLAVDGSVHNGDNVFLTFEARGNITSIGLFYWLQKTAPNIVKTSWLNGSSSISLSETEWTKFVTPIDTASANIRICTRILLFYNLGSANSGKWIELRKRSVKLERGTKPTDWTPAPEDVDADISSAEANAKGYADEQASEAYEKIRSQGIQLVTNGNGFMGDNTNFSWWTFDGSKSNGSPGSFTHTPYATTVSTDEMFPVDTAKDYIVEFDAFSTGSGAHPQLYAMLLFYDVDKKLMQIQQVSYIIGSTTTLARELKNGDTVIYLTDASGFIDTSNAHQRSLIFWDYTNSFGYTYPPETYSRNFYAPSGGLWSDYSKINKSSNTITLTTAWTGGTKPAGTYLSQNSSGANYAYFWYRTGTSFPLDEWTHVSGIYSGFQTGIANVSGKFYKGCSYCKIGWLWNYQNSSSNPQKQIWITNISVKEAVATKAELNSVATTANAAAPKSSAISRTQRIYWRATSNTKPSANTTWLATSGDGYGNWSLNVPQLTKGTTKYPYLFTTIQTQTVAQQAAGTTCTCSAVTIDDSTTVIDGGKIITGSVNANAINASSGTFDTANIPALTADHIKANVINAVNNGTGTINADKINASNLTIGYSQLTNTPTIPSKVSDLTNDSGFQTSSQVDTAITSKGYATTTQAQGYADAKDAAIAAAAKRTDVSIAVTAINYDLGTATLQATLYVDGTATTSNVTYKWLKDGSVISGQTARTLSVTAAMGLSHVYSCTVTYS